ncbi:MAG: hypothetical protein GXP33_02270 [Spirochaetes bacterium]|nr:hypothetical protein [Spirochaetota bacterium]
MKRFIGNVLLITLVLVSGWTQEQTKSTKQKTVQNKAPVSKINAEFPKENPNIIFVEGEDAVSTNFNKEPTLNYSCSGRRTLQLNRASGLQGGASFYADYVFYVPEGGEYELWYGGTPPGPKDDLYPSFVSPFKYTIDNKKTVDRYREDITVVENYAPSYYWNIFGDEKLKAGIHKIRFEVNQKRRYDNRFYFYLDNFFLIRKENGRLIKGSPLPDVFPKNMENRTINFPFRSIDDYLIIIREKSDNPQPLIELSLIYTLIGDYLNALKYLKRASLLAPDNFNILLLIAKNRIWRGDVSIGLKKYRELLKKNPGKLDLWIEAGKVAAWTGRYKESISFFKDGLKHFKDNLNLLINLGLTYMWASDPSDSEKSFKEAGKITADNVELIKKLAKIFIINGYAEYAIPLYKKAIQISPADLESYLLLEDTYLKTGKKEDAAGVDKLIQDTFNKSLQLSRYLSIYKLKQSLKERVISEYEDKLKANPDNLSLRAMLAQTYFWNGFKEKAINEYLNILANHAFRELTSMEKSSFPLLELIDTAYIFKNYFENVKEAVNSKNKELSDALDNYKKALKENNKFQKKVENARSKGKELPQPEGEDPYDVLKNAEDKLTDAVSSAAGLAEKIRSSISDYKKESEKIDSIKEKDKKEQTIFYKIIKFNRWRWNRTEFLNEMEQDSKRGLTLSKFITGRINQIEQRYKTSETIFNELTEKSPGSAEYQYALFQTLLWQGKTDEAKKLLAAMETRVAEIVPYFPDLQKLAVSLQEQNTGEAFLSDDPSADVSEKRQELTNITKEADKTQREINSRLKLLHGLLYQRMVRTFYHYEENTYLIRNELGGYYLNQKKLNDAIRQFKHVLAIEPNNISAIYRIGTVYQWNNNWSKAMQYYKRVYKIDPLYENTASLYNQLARKHSNALRFSTYYLADSSRIQWHAHAGYNGLLNSFLGFNLSYNTDNIRILKSLADDSSGSVQYYTNHSAYQTHEISAELPLDLYFMNLKLTPFAGSTLLSNELFYKSQQGVSEPADSKDNFGSYAEEPFFGLKSALGLGKFLYLTGTYRYGRYPETFAPTRKSIYDNSAEMNISLSLSSLDIPLIQDTSFRTYGKADILGDGNSIYTGVQEIYINLFKGGNPYSLITLSGNFTMQHSLRNEKYNYYSPVGVIIGGASLTGSTWIGIGESNVLGLSLRGYGGTYQENIFDPAQTKRRLKLEGEVNINLTSGSGYYYLGAMANGTYCYNSPDAADLNTWDYWSLYFKLGYTAKLPNLLAP